MTDAIARLSRVDPTIELRSQLAEAEARASRAEVRLLELEAQLDQALNPPEPEPEDEEEPINHSQWAQQQVSEQKGLIEIDAKLHPLLMERSWKAKMPVAVFVRYLNDELMKSGSAIAFIWPGEEQPNSGAAGS